MHLLKLIQRRYINYESANLYSLQSLLGVSPCQKDKNVPIFRWSCSLSWRRM